VAHIILLLLPLLLISIALPPSPPAIRTALPSFPGVPREADFAEAVEQITTRSILCGYVDGRFGPSDALLRAQVAVTLARAMRRKGATAAREFSDRGIADPQSWLAVRLLADNNIARGHVPPS